MDYEKLEKFFEYLARADAAYKEMAGTYDQRNICHDVTSNKFEIDTSIVTDRTYKYESAVSHPEFNRGAWVILDSAPDEESAKVMHQSFIDYFEEEGDSLEELVDAYTEKTYPRRRS